MVRWYLCYTIRPGHGRLSAVEVDRTHVSRVERAVANPTIDVLERIEKRWRSGFESYSRFRIRMKIARCRCRVVVENGKRVRRRYGEVGSGSGERLSHRSLRAHMPNSSASTERFP
jgi:hypothetical protein